VTMSLSSRRSPQRAPVAVRLGCGSTTTPATSTLPTRIWV
jgi:hypothetical protein